MMMHDGHNHDSITVYYVEHRKRESPKDLLSDFTADDWASLRKVQEQRRCPLDLIEEVPSDDNRSLAVEPDCMIEIFVGGRKEEEFAHRSRSSASRKT